MRHILLLSFLCPLLSKAADAPAPATQEMIRTLHEGANFKPYTDKATWLKRREFLRQQVLISAGLWPLPAKGPLHAVIHGRIDREDYTIEKVYFQSYPGFYVTGNLYRPKGKTGPFPAILSPHGHWINGRLYEAPEKEVKAQLAAGLEVDADAARYPMQARCAGLAKLGCIVFFYDMVGYADADPEHFPHKKTFVDLDSDLHGLSIFGLQTWDSIRALDFLESLPDADKSRLAITGASGGATQTIMMMSTDDRLYAAAPVCMISAGEHQGGCVCENNSLLRVGTDNVELAATFAPKPFIHPTATGDWTHEFLEHGFPEIKTTYKLFDAENNVESFRQEAPHNYNLKSREAVYNFFNHHLKLGPRRAIKETPFDPVPPRELSVWDGEHPRPKDPVDTGSLKKWWVEMTGKQIEDLKPKDAAGIEKAEGVLRPVLSHLLGPRNTNRPVKGELGPSRKVGEMSVYQWKWTVEADGRVVPLLGFSGPDKGVEEVEVLLTLPGGTAAALKADGTPIDLIAGLVNSGHGVTVPDLFTVYAPPPPPAGAKPAVEFFAGYNLSIPARRVQDLLVLLELRDHPKVDLIAVGDTAPVALLARALVPDRIDRTVIDGSALSAPPPIAETDANFLPHALRYGGLWPLASLGGTSPLLLHSLPEDNSPAWLTATFAAAGASDKLHIERAATVERIVEWLKR